MSSRMERQVDTLRRHLRRGKAITQLEALRFYGIARLAAAVYVLRKEMPEIVSELIQVPVRGGQYARVARYSLPAPVRPKRKRAK